jgi:hypothetical protein
VRRVGFLKNPMVMYLKLDSKRGGLSAVYVRL